MDLKSYFQLKRGNATALAVALDIPLTYLSQMASGERAVTPERASAIEKATNKIVTRADLFPRNFGDVWPELAPTQEKKVA